MVFLYSSLMSFLGHRYIKKHLRNRVPAGNYCYVRIVIGII